MKIKYIYEKGDIVIWTGHGSCIGKIKEEGQGDCWNLGSKHDGCSEVHLYPANERDKQRFKEQNKRSKPILINELR